MRNSTPLWFMERDITTFENTSKALSRAQGLCLPFRTFPWLAQNEESRGSGGEARGRGGLEEGEVAVKGATKLRPLAKALGAQFEISIDGTPRTYRDRKVFAIEAGEYLKSKHPNSVIVVKDLQSGEAITIKYKPDLGSR